MTTCLGKSCSFGLPHIPFVNCCQFMYLVISLLLLALRAGYGIWLYQFLIITYLFTFTSFNSKNCQPKPFQNAITGRVTEVCVTTVNI